MEKHLWDEKLGIIEKVVMIAICNDYSMTNRGPFWYNLRKVISTI